MAGRVVAAVVSFLGLFGLYLFTRECFSQREAILAAMLYVVCPPVLFHNNQFIAETFLFSTAPFLYWALLRAMRSRRRKLIWWVAAIPLGMALLLFKQSGALLLGVAMALPFAELRRHEESSEGMSVNVGRGGALASWNWKGLAANLLGVGVIILCSHVAARLVIPSEFNQTKEIFNRQWVLSLQEIFQFPLPTWRANLEVAAVYIDSYYSWGVMLFFGASLWFAIRKRNPVELALAAMCVAGGGAIIFLLRGFNEYLLNTSVIVVLLPLLARTGVNIWQLARDGKERLIRAGGFMLTGLMLIFWMYQLILMGSSPGKYLERSTHWAVANYLKGWPTGFGVKEVVAMLAQEKEPGVIFTDTQWGNPATALEVYKDRFPHLRLIPISKDFLDPPHMRQLKEAARKIGPAHYAIGSADRSEGRGQWLAQVEREMCETQTEVKAYPSQSPIIVCQF